MSRPDVRIDATSPDTTHPSLRPPEVPGRRSRSFAGEVDTPARRTAAPGLVDVAASVADGAGPVGRAVSAGLSALGAGRGPADPRDAEIDRMWAMQRESQAFNVEYLALQESMQGENRRFTTMSNLLKARHDTSKSAIANIRV